MRDLTAFNARLASTFGAAYRSYWNAAVGRYAVDTPTADGKTVVQFWCQFYDPTTLEPLEADPVTSLHPYRDLDEVAQEEVIRNLHRSYIGKTGHGLRDWDLNAQVSRKHNADLKKAKLRARADTYADLIAEVNSGRPYLKHHSGTPTQRRLAREHR